MDKRYSKANGSYCSVIGCNNSGKKRFLWECEQCQKHQKLKMYCKCPRPFKFHRFPNGSTDVSRLRRMTWISNLKRKDFKPHKGSVVCSVHFSDGKPTDDHPYPEFFLGHSQSIVKGRSKNRKMNLNGNKCVVHSKTGGIDGVAEFVDICSNDVVIPVDLVDHRQTTDATTQVTTRQIGTQTPRSRKQNQVSEEHNYANTKVTTREMETQTQPSDFLTEDNVNFLTGLPHIHLFFTLVTICNSMAVKGKFKILPIADQLLLLLMRLRLGLLQRDLAYRFFVSKALVGQLLSFWMKALSSKLSPLLAFIPNDVVQKSMPMAIRMRYPKLRCIIDCTEIFTEKPMKLLPRAQMYSNYKAHQTVKYLIGISPNGLITFISAGYSGRASDLCVVRNSGFLELVQPKDQIMADRGFNIQEDLRKRGAKLIIPNFTRGKSQLTHGEVLHTRRVANVRIHVERAIRRIRCFRILNGNFPLSQIKQLDDTLRVICILCNLKKHLIKV